MTRFNNVKAKELALQISVIYKNLKSINSLEDYFISEYSLRRFKYPNNIFSKKVAKRLRLYNGLSIIRVKYPKGFILTKYDKNVPTYIIDKMPEGIFYVKDENFDIFNDFKSNISENIISLTSVLDSIAIKKENINKFYPPKFYDNIKNCVENGEHVYIHGPSGCGKTTTLRTIVKEMYPQFCKNGVYPFDIDFSQGVDEATFLGTKEATVDVKGNNITKFSYGVFPQAVISGIPIIVNEIDSAPPHYLTALHSILDDENPKLVLMDNAGEVLVPTNGFVLLATANSLGLGENQQKFAGTVQLNEAFLDRFSAFFEMSYTDKEIEIVNNLLASNETDVNRIMLFISDIRKSNSSENIMSTISTRRLKMFVKKINEWGLRIALENVIYARLDIDDRNIVKEIAQRHFPKK